MIYKLLKIMPVELIFVIKSLHYVFEAHLAMLWGSSELCTQESLLASLGGKYRVQGGKSRSATSNCLYLLYFLYSPYMPCIVSVKSVLLLSIVRSIYCVFSLFPCNKFLFLQFLLWYLFFLYNFLFRFRNYPLFLDENHFSVARTHLPMG